MHSVEPKHTTVVRFTPLNVLVVLVATVLALPIGFAVWSMKQARDLGNNADRAVAALAAYDDASDAADALRDRSASAAKLERARWRIERAVAVATRTGGRVDRSLGNAILLALDAHANATARRTGARSRGQATAASRYARRQRQLAVQVETRIDQAAAASHDVLRDSMDGGGRANGLALLSLLALAGLSPLVLRRSQVRRRVEWDDAENEQLRDLALKDNLTGLRNHRAFQEDFGRELQRRNRNGGPLSLMMVDLDGLKEINDSYGHQAGDERIKTLATCLRATMRDSDIAYRIGGDEYMVILPGERAWGAFQVAQRLRARTTAAGVGIAVGITETITYELKDAVIRRADLSLIEAKRSHRNTVIYSKGLEPKPSGANESAGRHHSKILATALARAVDAKDGSTRNHCETVSELCVRIGEELGLAEERLGRLRLAGLLHDVGKIGIADAILQKPTVLDAEETEVMRTHVRIGHGIITAAELHEEAEFVLHHHERVDGRGYPDGLAGDAIPLESRIILVADTFEAITSDRPYRDGRGQQAALAELERHAGTQFDPDCVAALRRALGVQPAVEDEPGATVVPIRRAVA